MNICVQISIEVPNVCLVKLYSIYIQVYIYPRFFSRMKLNIFLLLLFKIKLHFSNIAYVAITFINTTTWKYTLIYPD
jgi:hypothetical protein